MTDTRGRLLSVVSLYNWKNDVWVKSYYQDNKSCDVKLAPADCFKVGNRYRMSLTCYPNGRMMVLLWELLDGKMRFITRNDRQIDLDYRALFDCYFKSVSIASSIASKDKISYAAVYNQPLEMQEIIYNLGHTITPIIEVK